MDTPICGKKRDKRKKKNKDLEEAGFTILRFNDEDVLDDIDNVIRVLSYEVEVRRKELNIQPPNPRQREKY